MFLLLSGAQYDVIMFVGDSFVRNKDLYYLLKVLDFGVAEYIWSSAHFSSLAKRELHGITTHGAHMLWGRCRGPFTMSHHVIDITLPENVT